MRHVFPEAGFHDNEQFTKLNQSIMGIPEILKFEIIYPKPNTAMEFIDCTFAEYLVADYFVLFASDLQTTEAGQS